MKRPKMRAQSGLRRFARQEMHKFKVGKLHSGSKKGPIVRSREQAIAIMLSQAREKGLLRGKVPKKKRKSKIL